MRMGCDKFSCAETTVLTANFSPISCNTRVRPSTHLVGGSEAVCFSLSPDPTSHENMRRHPPSKNVLHALDLKQHAMRIRNEHVPPFKNVCPESMHFPYKFPFSRCFNVFVVLSAASSLHCSWQTMHAVRMMVCILTGLAASLSERSTGTYTARPNNVSVCVSLVPPRANKHPCATCATLRCAFLHGNAGRKAPERRGRSKILWRTPFA